MKNCEDHKRALIAALTETTRSLSEVHLLLTGYRVDHIEGTGDLAARLRQARDGAAALLTDLEGKRS